MKTFITSKWSVIHLIRAAFLSMCLFSIPDLPGQNIAAILTESWENASWTPNVRSLNTYDGNDHLTNTISQTWDADLSSWTNAFQWNFTNNPDGTVSQMIGQLWMTGSWSDSSRTTYAYTAFGEQLTAVSDIWTGTAWMPISKQTNTYDAGQHLTNVLMQSWDFISSGWQNSTQSNYTNNANGTVNEVIDQSWNTGTSSWENTEKTNYTYNASNAVLTAIDQNWTGSWVNDTKITNTYDGGNRITNSLSQDWDVAGSIWVNSGQDNYTYNGDDTINQIVSQEWESGAWVNAYRITFTYNPLAVQGFDYQNAQAYPNPAQDVINIKSNTALSDRNYTIVDLSGKLLLIGRLDEDAAINVERLAAGIYFIRIGQQRSIKIIKE